MIKVSLLALTIAGALSTASWAQQNHSATQDFEGFYLGGSVGLVSYDLEGLSDDVQSSNFGGFAGYRGAIGTDWILGGEVYGQFENASKTFTRRTAEIKVEADHSYGLDATFGHAFDSHLVFGILGYGWTQYSTEFPDQLTGDFDDTVGSWRIGLGYEKAFDNAWSLRVRGIYQDYDKDDKALRAHLDIAYRF